MKEKETTRTYRMKARAEAAAQTGRDILAATADLWRERGLDEITLQEIADRAGVSVQTVIRRFGSKEGVIEACIEADAGEVRKGRDQAPAGDIEAALDTILDHYERDGDAVLRTLALEDKLDSAKAIVTTGRREHRRWCAVVFGPFLPDPSKPDYELLLDAFVAATDVYAWKLFRHDLGHSRERTRRAIGVLVQGLIHIPNPQ